MYPPVEKLSAGLLHILWNISDDTQKHYRYNCLSKKDSELCIYIKVFEILSAQRF